MAVWVSECCLENCSLSGFSWSLGGTIALMLAFGAVSFLSP